MTEESINTESVWKELSSFKKRFYLNRILKGSILFFSSILSVFLVWNVLEFSFAFGTTIRAFLFFSFLAVALGSIYFFLLDPILVILGIRKQISDAEAAKKIGEKIPSIGDKLLNLVQLKQFSGQSALAKAGLLQKSKAVSGHHMGKAVTYRSNTRYIKYFISPFSVIVILLFFRPEIFKDSSERIINYSETYIPKAPFTFEIKSEPLAFKNEDYKIELELNGSAVPDEAYLILNNRKIKLFRNEANLFTYTFSKIQYEKSLHFEAAGFIGPEVKIKVVERPNLKNFNVFLNYPKYTGKKDERFSNTGNMQIPEGTKVSWEFGTIKTDELNISFESDSTTNATNLTNNELYEFEKTFLNSDNYFVQLKNKYSSNREKIQYRVDVIKDQFPAIDMNIYADTLLYNLIVLGGNISDDYGLRRLSLDYEVLDAKSNTLSKKSIPIRINTSQISQGYYYQWRLDSLNIQAGNQLKYHLRVWDNDAINGSKSSKTGTYRFKLPSNKEIRAELAKSTKKTQSQLDKTLQKAKELENKIKEAREKMKGKKQLTWEDQKALKELLKKREDINKALEELKLQSEQNNQQKDRFSPQNEQLKEKTQQLQNIINDMMDEETMQMYEELKKLLEQKAGVDQVQQMMEQINKRERNLEKELERTMELFKQLKLENEINQTVDQLEKNAQKELELSDKTLNEKEDSNSLIEEQKEITEEFNDIKESLNKIEEMNQELDRPQAMPDVTQGEKSIEENLKESKEELQKLSEEKNPSENSDQEKNSSNSEEKKNEQTNSNSEQSNSDKKEDSNSEDSTEDSENNENKEGKEETEPREGQEGENQESSEEDNEGENQEPPSSEEKEQSRSKAGRAQKKAAQQMQQMAQQMKSMSAGMEMEMMTENINDLRNILYNLITLSFNQEQLMDNFRDVAEIDPKYIELSQTQLKLRDDSRVIEDSLMSLATRVFQIQSFVTEEVTKMNEHMEASTDALKERKKYIAVGEQQYAMTSMNNLALLLDDVLDQMMNAMSSMGKGKGKKKSNERNQEELGKMQQKLNESLKELKDSGKSGRKLSEELAKLAAEQERIRKALEAQQKRIEELNQGEGGSKPGQGIPQQMEKSELDMVNKRITEQLIRRQEAILTRLLEAEDAMREKEMDEERKAETARDYDKIVPDAFEDYLKLKEKEVEMLKTLPPKLYPYYKKEVSEYFKRIGEGIN